MTLRTAAVLAPAVLAATTLVSAAELTLNGITYPDNRRIEVELAATPAAPVAELSVAVRFKSGQASVEVTYSGLEPAVLFGGDVTTYVLWAVPPVAAAENLGELGAAGTKGSTRASTRLKSFALVVTAEPLLTVTRPSELLVFTSKATASKHARNVPFAYSGFLVRDQIDVGKPSIRGMKFERDEELILIQARKAMELVERFDAAEHAPAAAGQAKTALAQATNLFQTGGSKATAVDYARRAIELSSQALTNKMRDIEDRAEAARLAREQATTEALGLSEEARRQLEVERRQLQADKAELVADKAELVADKAKLEADKAKLVADKAKLEGAKEVLEGDKEALEGDKEALVADRAKLQAELDQLAGRLSGALAKVSSTERTARGLVVSFGDINFATNKAALADNAKLNVAKLAGILLMMPDVNLRVEGHTDSTGTAEINTKLSADRADSVRSLLVSMGVAEGRIVAEGYGSANPIAPNDTREGRARNRRVDIVLNEGTIAAPPAPVRF